MIADKKIETYEDVVEVVDFLIESFTQNPQFGMKTTGSTAGLQCVYLDHNTGAQCAVGRLLYKDGMYEGGPTDDAIDGLVALERNGWFVKEGVRQKLMSVQRIHDGHAIYGGTPETMIATYKSWKEHGFPTVADRKQAVDRVWENPSRSS